MTNFLKTKFSVKKFIPRFFSNEFQKVHKLFWQKCLFRIHSIQNNDSLWWTWKSNWFGWFRLVLHGNFSIYADVYVFFSIYFTGAFSSARIAFVIKWWVRISGPVEGNHFCPRLTCTNCRHRMFERLLEKLNKWLFFSCILNAFFGFLDRFKSKKINFCWVLIVKFNQRIVDCYGNFIKQILLGEGIFTRRWCIASNCKSPWHKKM